MGYFDRLTETARKAVAVANQQTHSLHGSAIGDVELLLGIVTEGTGTAVKVLRDLGVELALLKAELRQQPRERGDESTPAKLPQTYGFRLAIEAAIVVACDLRHAQVGTQHVLLGLLKFPESACSRILAEQGVTFEKVRASVEELGDGGFVVER